METGDRKLNEVPKVTDMAYVPVIMSDGSIGQIAKSDLASVVAGVLGNPIGDKSYYIEKDLNNLTTNGIYSCYYTKGDRLTEANYPNTASTYFQIVVYKSTSWIKQVATNVNSNEIFERVKDGTKEWSPWQRIDNFGYNSLAELAGGVAGCLRVKTELYMEMNTTKTINLGIGIFKIYYKSQPDHQTMLISISEDTVSVMGESWFTKHLSFSLTETSSLNVTYTAADNTFVFEKISL